MLSANRIIRHYRMNNGKQTRRSDFAHVWDESESVHFAHARRHLFPQCGPSNPGEMCLDSCSCVYRSKEVDNISLWSPRQLLHINSDIQISCIIRESPYQIQRR